MRVDRLVPMLKTSTNQQARSLAALDRAHVLHPHATVGDPAEPLIIQRGKGATVWDIDGRSYVDGTCGLWQCAIGHGRHELANAASAQMRRLEFYASFWDLSNSPSIELAARLAELSPPGLDRAYFTSGGSEAISAAIRLARLAHHASGDHDRNVILSRQRAYHGSGGLSGAATELPGVKDGVGPQPDGFVHLSAADGHRLGPDAADMLVAELEATIDRLGGHRIAAFIGEPVMGVAGMIPPPAGYWPRIAKVLADHGILLILDEVVTAFGRLGRWFAAERYDVNPDLLVCAKGITSGYFPLGAVLLSRRIEQMLDGQPFRYGFTYNGHPVGSAVALRNLQIIEQENLLLRAEQQGAYLKRRLDELGSIESVAEVRGVGLMAGIELARGDAAEVASAARRAGVIVRANAQTIVLSPPLVISRTQIDTIVDVLGTAITDLEGS